MTTNTIYILIPLSLIIGFAYKFFYRKKTIGEPIEMPLIKLSEKELNLIESINEYRLENNVKELPSHNDIKHFANTRTSFWKKFGYTKNDNLHDLIGEHQTPFLKTGYSEIAENAGITSYPFTAFKNSSTHNKIMLDPRWDFISASILNHKDKPDYVCLAFGKKASKQTWFI